MDNTKELQLLSLCTGYGGIERGLELTGLKFRTVAHVEIEAFAVANLVAKMENNELVPSPVWTNLKTLPLEVFRGKVDIITGGYPCQPFSVAGNRKGSEDPRHLWPYIERAIDVIQPGMCFFENVEGHINLGLREVIESLESRGYKVSWGIFSASEVGASHQRKRVFILGHSNGINGRESAEGRINEAEIGSTSEELADSRSKGSQGHGESIEHKQTYPFPSRPSEPQYEWEEQRCIESSMGRTVNGSSCRVDELRLLGNGVVPQTAAKAFLTLNERINYEQ